MTGTWMVYALAVSGVAAAGALGLERALERLGRPTRWVWVSAMLVGVLAPVAALLRAPLPAATPASGSGSLGGFAPVDLSTLSASPAAPALTLDGVLLAGWGAASLVVTLSFLWSAGSLMRAKRRWRRARVEGWGVWVSETTGPAVVGFLRPAIVLPAWVLEWETELKRLIVRHEREHVRAGDGRLLLTALLLLCAAPWNVALWWEWRRLRQAVETDCDRRVLRSQPDVRRYGTLLLEVANRTRRHALPLAAFAEPRSFLERRLRMMTNRQARNRAGWIAALAGALVLTPALLLALPAPRPVGVAGVRALLDGWVGEEGPSQGGAVAAAPPLARTAADTALLEIARVVLPAHHDTVPAGGTFAYELAVLQKAPRLRNTADVREMMNFFYPPLLADAGIGGTTMMQFAILPDGSVDQSSVRVISTTRRELSEPSTRVAEKFNFEPGIYNGKPVRVLLQMPITWKPADMRRVDAVGYGHADSQSRPALRESHLSTPALLAIREIVTQRHRAFLGSATGQSKVLLVVVHPDARVEHTALANGSMDPYALGHTNLAPGVPGDRIDKVDVMTSTDLATIAKDLNAVIWVTLKS